VSLVAIAAIVATMTVARQRNEERRSDSAPPDPGREPVATKLNLDALRSAGL